MTVKNLNYKYPPVPCKLQTAFAFENSGKKAYNLDFMVII